MKKSHLIIMNDGYVLKMGRKRLVIGRSEIEPTMFRCEIVRVIKPDELDADLGETWDGFINHVKLRNYGDDVKWIFRDKCAVRYTQIYLSEDMLEAYAMIHFQYKMDKDSPLKIK